MTDFATRARQAFAERTDAVGTRARVLFGDGTDVGVGPAGKQVAEDLSQLVKAEVALAKAELTADLKANARGPAMFAGAGVFGWLGIQALLFTIGIALALVMPAWAAALIVTVILFAGAATLGLVGKKAMDRRPPPMATTKQNVTEDVTWIKQHLPSR